MLPESPDSIIHSLRNIMAESAKGVDALYSAEIKVAEAELTYDSEYQKKFIEAGGTVADRQAVARLQTWGARALPATRCRHCWPSAAWCCVYAGDGSTRRSAINGMPARCIAPLFTRHGSSLK